MALVPEPTREHWVQDATACMLDDCPRTFTFRERRHHCRRCGKAVCATHSKHKAKLGADAQFHANGALVRVCDNCFSLAQSDEGRHALRDPNEPTRVHWLPDSAATECMYEACSKQFNLIERRTHCRKCGKIYCAQHRRFLRPLNARAEFDTNGVLSKVCVVCYSEGADYGDGERFFPRRDHWVDDSQVTECTHHGCDRVFSPVIRKSHCRRCGGVYCKEHVSLQRPLNYDAEYDPIDGQMCRVCATCYEETREKQEFGQSRDHWKRFTKLRNKVGDFVGDVAAAATVDVLQQISFFAHNTEATANADPLAIFKGQFVTQEEYERKIVDWAPDAAFSHCPTCGKSFTLFNRRHHCRLCGAVRDDACTEMISLGRAPYNPDAPEDSEEQTRACLGCITNLERWMKRAEIASRKHAGDAHPIKPVYDKINVIWQLIDELMPQFEAVVNELAPQRRLGHAARPRQNVTDALAITSLQLSPLAARSSSATDRSSSSTGRSSSTRSTGRSVSSSAKQNGKTALDRPRQEAVEEMRKLASQLSNLFTNYQAFIKVLNTMPAKLPLEAKLIKNLRTAQIDHLQENLVYYKKLVRRYEDAERSAAGGA